MLPPRLGESIIIASRRQARRSPRGLPIGDGSRLERLRLRRRARRTDVPKIVDWYMEGKINIDD